MKKIFLRRIPKAPKVPPVKPPPEKKFFTVGKRKALSAVVLVVLLLALLQLPYPAAREIQTKVVALLTSSQADWTPTLNQWAREGIWQDSFDKQVFQQTYQENMLLPVSGKTQRLFEGNEHTGVDIVTEKGALVKAALSGEVIPFSSGPSDNAVAVRHTNDRVTIYAGLKSVTVDVGQVVPQGKILGVADGMVHFEVRVRNAPVNPLPFLSVTSKL